MIRDLFDADDEAQRATAPALQSLLAQQAVQSIVRRKTDGRVFFPPVLSATGTCELIRDVMWWKPTVLRRGESYEAFKKRADAQRAQT